MLKRSFSMMLAFVMLLSLLSPFTAQAENITVVNNDNASQTTSPQVIKEKLVNSLEKAKQYYITNNQTISSRVISSHSGYWSLSAMYALGMDIKNYKWAEGSEVTSEKSYWVKPKAAASSTSNEDAGTIIGAYILGLDPTNLGQRNIVEDLQNKQKADGSFFTAYGESWASIALGLANANYDKAKHLEVILKKQNNSGLFSGFGSSDDLDVTGWNLTALTLLNDADNSNETINESIKKAVDGIHAKYQKDGFVDNTNSMASIIMGLATAGEDLTADKWSYEKDGKKVNILEKMIDDYQLEDGSFKWMIKDTKTNLMATEQVIIALADALNGKSTFARLAAGEIPDTNPPVENPDTVGPIDLTVGTISNKTTSVTGTTEANATVSIYNGTKLLASTKANSKGTFTVKIPAQKANVNLVVKTADEAGNAGITKTITVIDKIGPTKLTVGTISNKTTSVKGTTEAKATVSIYKGSKLLTSTKASSKGNYTLKIAKQKENVKLVVKTKDTVGNKGVSKTIIVKDKIAPKKPTVSKITSKTTKVKGKTEAKATITIYNSKHKKIGSAKASSKGNFSVKIKKQKANTKLSIYAKDLAGNKSSKLSVKVK
ncbi:Ig-like domain-containing protein [Viridibacillus arvi]|uniref:Ig-like domain-containing protein n=1 Tax=Viridibacillus arvi TaxID=263475 RepID=UPI003D03BCDE